MVTSFMLLPVALLFLYQHGLITVYRFLFQPLIHALFLLLHYLAIITEPLIGFYLQHWSVAVLKTIPVTL